jgi:NAD(P)H-hydrate epimerase
MPNEKRSTSAGLTERISMDIHPAAHQIPFLSTDQMREVDRAMMEDYHIQLIQMMENAGRSLARLASLRFLASSPEGQRVVVLAGSGGNGGGVLVCARWLHNWGVRVQVVLTRPEAELRGVPAHQLDILKRLQVPTLAAGQVEQAADAELIIDGLIGYSLQGTPRGPAADLIRWANSQAGQVLALDLPSGLEATTGTLHSPTIWANATLTLALPKQGLRAPGVKPYVGELYLADISVPPALYQGPGLKVEVGALFAESEIIRLW